jgi:glutamyl-tRNA reductase
VDDLQQVVANTVAQRTGAIDAARAIVARHVDEFAAWHRQREMGPIIDRLSKRYHRVAKEELDRTVNKLSNVTPADRANLEDLVRRVVNKLLHNPIRTLRTSEGQHSGLTYLHAMEKLFDLEKAEEAEAAIPPEDPAAPDQGGQTSG